MGNVSINEQKNSLSKNVEIFNLFDNKEQFSFDYDVNATGFGLQQMIRFSENENKGEIFFDIVNDKNKTIDSFSATYEIETINCFFIESI